MTTEDSQQPTLANPKPGPKRKWVSWLLPVGGFLGVLVGTFITFSTQGTFLHHKEVWFIFDDGQSGGPGHPGRDLADGIRAAKRDNERFFLDKRILLKIVSDHGNVVTAREKALEAAENSNVVAVIGHLSSSTMSEVLDIYSGHDLPVIMPVPTNPRFTQTSDSSSHNFIRMPPTDDTQSAVARDFMFTQHVQRIAVIKDADNSVYSEYLARKFISDVRDRAVQPGGPRVVYVSTVGGSTAEEFLPPIFTDLNIDAVFFAGSTDNAISFLETLLAAHQPDKPQPDKLQPDKLQSDKLQSDKLQSDKLPLILMTDGVVDAKLLKKISTVPPKLYVTFPLSEDAAPNGRCAGKFVLSYCPYGYDSVELIKQISEELVPSINENPLKKWWFNVGRSDIVNYFNSKLKADSAFPYELHGYFNKRYTFDKLGDNNAFKFSVWRADPEKREFVKE